eukprot:619942-Prymnesium_polylepis.2
MKRLFFRPRDRRKGSGLTRTVTCSSPLNCPHAARLHPPSAHDHAFHSVRQLSAEERHGRLLLVRRRRRCRCTQRMRLGGARTCGAPIMVAPPRAAWACATAAHSTPQRTARRTSAQHTDDDQQTDDR